MKRRLWGQLGITIAEFTRHFIDPRRVIAASRANIVRRREIAR